VSQLSRGRRNWDGKGQILERISGRNPLESHLEEAIKGNGTVSLYLGYDWEKTGISLEEYQMVGLLSSSCWIFQSEHQIS
jgi:hypothetical protein